MQEISVLDHWLGCAEDMMILRSIAFTLAHKILEFVGLILAIKLVFGLASIIPGDSILDRWSSISYVKDSIYLLYIGLGFLFVSVLADIFGVLAGLRSKEIALVSAFPILLYLSTGWMLLFPYTAFFIFMFLVVLLSFLASLMIAKVILPKPTRDVTGS